MRLYDLRREPVMRESREALNVQFWPRDYEDIVAITKREHELNRAFRQVGTFWEMAYGMVKHGIVNAEYFLESNGEGFFLFTKVHPYLEAYRRDVNALAFRNAGSRALNRPDCSVEVVEAMVMDCDATLPATASNATQTSPARAAARLTLSTPFNIKPVLP